MFDEALDRVIADNADFVPPYGSGGSMYIRPFLFGHEPKLGLGPAPEYAFCLVASPHACSCAHPLMRMACALHV